MSLQYLSKTCRLVLSPIWLLSAAIAIAWLAGGCVPGETSPAVATPAQSQTDQLDAKQKANEGQAGESNSPVQQTARSPESSSPPPTRSDSNETLNQSTAVADQPDVKTTFRKITKKGVDYLLQKGMAEDGSYSKQLSPAVTALCVSALLEHGVPVSDERIQRSLKFLEAQIKPDGGIYAKDSNLRNYETSVSLMCFNRANDDNRYDRTIQEAIAFLKGIQWDEGETHTIDSAFFGGQGYGSHKRPDLSNTSYFLDALHAVTDDSDGDAFKKAAVFVSRAQNLPHPEHNTSEWATKVSKSDWGGMIYTPVGKGESKALETPEGGLRSYASMTYAGLKSFLYAGITKDDIRVKAAMDWISRHYDLTQNPGVGQQGLFYYYHVFAKALNAYGDATITDSDGKEHNWRADLTMRLGELQNEDGSWTNPADRWYEGDPNLVTAYSLLALSYCE